MTNTELTLDQLQAISGGASRARLDRYSEKREAGRQRTGGGRG